MADLKGVYALRTVQRMGADVLVLEVDATASWVRIGEVVEYNGKQYRVTKRGQRFRKDVRDHRLYLYVEEVQ